MNITRIAAATHTGFVRASNEDRYGATGLIASPGDGDVVGPMVRELPCLVVIADGLGGHPSGEIASALATEVLLGAPVVSAVELVEAVRGANRSIFDAMKDSDDLVGMGTTVAALLVHHEGLVVVNIGDSPVYELVEGRLVQLSTDDVPVGRSDLPGLRTAVVTQTLGGRRAFSDVEPHCHEDALPGPRRILLCTDGLPDAVSGPDIARALSQEPAENAVLALLQLALDGGGPDNVTCVVVDVE